MSLSSTLGTYISANHNRAIVPSSQFGTRRIQFYGIYISGYNITNESGWEVMPNSQFDSWRNVEHLEWHYGSIYENLESYKSILYPIIRGVTTQAEIFLNGFPTHGESVSYPGEDDYGTFLTVGLAQNTTMDGEQLAEEIEDGFRDLEWQIARSIADFDWNYVEVNPLTIEGWGFYPVYLGGGSLNRGPAPKAASTVKPARLFKSDLVKKK